MLEVLREDLKAIFQASGFHLAENWNDRKLTKKLPDLIDVADESEVVIDDERLAELFKEIIDEGAGNIQIVSELSDDDDLDDEDADDDDLDDEDADEDNQEDNQEEEVNPEIEEAADDVAKELEALEAQKQKLKEKKALLRKKKAEVKKKSGKTRSRGVPGPDVGNPENVNSLRNRLYFAGVVVKEVGIEKGITKEVIQRINELAGKENDKASLSQAIFAWHGINGYIHGE